MIYSVKTLIYTMKTRHVLLMRSHQLVKRLLMPKYQATSQKNLRLS